MPEFISKADSAVRVQRRGRIFIVAFVIVLLGVVTISLTTNLARQASKASPKATGLPIQLVTPVNAETLDIISGTARHPFTIEVMRTDADRARGLMFRQSMPQDHGMLFDFERDQMVTMWMKNTFLALDMVFVTVDGRIHRIESNTEPQSERVISSGVPVRGVLELNAGVAAKLGLKPGDKLVHSMFR